AVVAFERVGPRAGGTTTFAEEIALALWRLRWIRVTAPPHARYHLRGTVHEDDRGVARVTVRLIDAPTGRYLWAASWDGDARDAIGVVERVAIGVTRAIQPALRAAEVDRASRRDRGDLTAWDLTMRA